MVSKTRSQKRIEFILSFWYVQCCGTRLFESRIRKEYVDQYNSILILRQNILEFYFFNLKHFLHLNAYGRVNKVFIFFIFSLYRVHAHYAESKSYPYPSFFLGSGVGKNFKLAKVKDLSSVTFQFLLPVYIFQGFFV